MNAFCLCQAERFLSSCFEWSWFHCILFWNRTANDNTMKGTFPLGASDGCDGRNVIGSMGQTPSTGTHVEGGKLIGLPANDGYSLGLQVLQGEVEVQD